MFANLIRFTHALGALVVLTSANMAFAEGVATPLNALLRHDLAGITAIPGERLETLARLPSAKAMRKDSQPAQADAIYTEQWLAGQPVPTKDAEWHCLTEALYFEVRGESLKGQFAVAEVIMNRVHHQGFPNSVCGVVNQGTGRKFACQFTFTCDGREEHVANPAAFARLGKIARAMIDGAPRTLTGGATHYHNHNVVPSWASSFERTASIGFHTFYRMSS